MGDFDILESIGRFIMYFLVGWAIADIGYIVYNAIWSL